ncbi:fungal-specific transcription factor domain-containing protein [Mycena crocata]|nr:fungal-specific transcription factor domain-containing protein [Mycena crocata]
MTDDNGDLVPGSKRRRLRGACDICKKRKIKCDSAEMAGNKCSNCLAFDSDCTHDLKALPRKSGRSKPLSTQVSPDAPYKTPHAHVAAIVLHGTEYITNGEVRQVLLNMARYARSLELDLVSRKQSPPLTIATRSSSSPHPSTEDEEDDYEFVDGILTERFERFRQESDADRYFGKSSHYELINTALGAKGLYVEDVTLSKNILPPTKRPQFWYSHWEHPAEILAPLIFPEPDLLQSLISLFFSRVNIVICLLHQPTFEKSVASGLHLVDYDFGSTVLGVCALAAKYSDDPRVILEGTNTQLSSGWKYFRQLQPLRHDFMRTFTLYEAQTLCLCVLYRHGSSAPDGCWILGGLGIRYAQQVGVHRRKRYDDQAVEEQWKRVFWLLICIDTLSSSICGRPRSTTSNDYDLDYPISCNDEYWETSDPTARFKQPPGKPSTLSYLIIYLKLIEIMGMAQETIYLVSQKDKSEEWKQNSVASLDSALNAWVDLIPDHLRWDPRREDPRFATQSAVIYTTYYHVQMQVHRIFINLPSRKCGLIPCREISETYTSMAICVSSARACSHVMDVVSRRGLLCNPHILNPLFDACILLLLHVWCGRQVGFSSSPQGSLQDVDTCLRILREYESRWQIAGRLHDIITELMSATNVDREYSPNPLKRGSDGNAELAAPTNTAQLTEPHQIPPSPPLFSSHIPGLELDDLFSLPMYTEDLSRIPNEWTSSWEKDSLDMTDQMGDVAAPPEPLFPNSTAHGTLSRDSLAALTATPAGYDWENWSKYITTMEDLTNSLDNPNTAGL